MRTLSSRRWWERPRRECSHIGACISLDFEWHSGDELAVEFQFDRAVEIFEENWREFHEEDERHSLTAVVCVAAGWNWIKLGSTNRVVHLFPPIGPDGCHCAVNLGMVNRRAMESVHDYESILERVGFGVGNLKDLSTLDVEGALCDLDPLGEKAVLHSRVDRSSSSAVFPLPSEPLGGHL